ncbi:hypothetical protein BDFB_006439 [Asbolus verrucosus]|uniref:Uncharacterized protein n=1 Tax=Asbolus verrucosus TaxID=1661398 RepID=A0A482VNQ9_ASBVE|nr:hypothetical protein BDFB_006439 [Asbolus verrucosus]
MKSYHGNTMVLRALNTIKQGQQCFVNRYSLRYDAYPRAERARMLVAGGLSPCQCTACRKDWTPCSGDLPWICNGLGIEPTDFRDVVKEVIGVNIEAAKAHLPRLISLLQQCERSEPSGSALTLKKLIAHCYVIFGNKRLL